MNTGFDRPLLLIAAFIIVPLAAYILSRMKNPFVANVPLGAPGGVPFKAPQMGSMVKFLKALEFIGVLLLFAGAAGPVVRTPEMVWLNRGADIIFILDISPSMAAIDMDGRNRFVAARNLLIEFADRRPTDSIGLVVVGSDAALLVPPTSDREALHARLESLRIGEMGDGTALGMGLAVAAYHLERSTARRKVAVLITDGENNAGAIHPVTAAGMIRDIGASLWVIGVGSPGEVPIDYLDPFTGIRHTGIYDSRFDTESLRLLSLVANGTYIFAPTADTFAAAFSRLDEGELTVQISRIIDRRHSIAVQFLIAGAALLAIVRFSRRLMGAMA